MACEQSLQGGEVLQQVTRFDWTKIHKFTPLWTSILIQVELPDIMPAHFNCNLTRSERDLIVVNFDLQPDGLVYCKKLCKPQGILVFYIFAIRQVQDIYSVRYEDNISRSIIDSIMIYFNTMTFT